MLPGPPPIEQRPACRRSGDRAVVGVVAVRARPIPTPWCSPLATLVRASAACDHRGPACAPGSDRRAVAAGRLRRHWTLLMFGAVRSSCRAATAFAAFGMTRLLDVTLIGALQPVLIIASRSRSWASNGRSHLVRRIALRARSSRPRRRRAADRGAWRATSWRSSASC